MLRIKPAISPTEDAVVAIENEIGTHLGCIPADDALDAALRAYHTSLPELLIILNEAKNYDPYLQKLIGALLTKLPGRTT